MNERIDPVIDAAIERMLRRREARGDSTGLAGAVGRRVREARPVAGRAIRWPWTRPGRGDAGNGRFGLSARGALLAVAVAALLVALSSLSVGIIGSRTGPQPSVSSSPSPSPQPSATPSPDASPSPSESALSLPDADYIPIVGGVRYRRLFPGFRFDVPAQTVWPLGPDEVIYGSGSLSWFRGTDSTSISAAWKASIQDMGALEADMCHPGATTTRVTATVAAVGVWLASLKGVTVSASTPIAVDGRSAARWDVTFGPSYGDAQNEVGKQRRVYAIPTTGNRMMIVEVWVRPDVSFGKVATFVDRIVATIHFD